MAKVKEAVHFHDNMPLYPGRCPGLDHTGLQVLCHTLKVFYFHFKLLSFTDLWLESLFSKNGFNLIHVGSSPFQRVCASNSFVPCTSLKSLTRSRQSKDSEHDEAIENGQNMSNFNTRSLLKSVSISVSKCVTVNQRNKWG